MRNGPVALTLMPAWSPYSSQAVGEVGRMLDSVSMKSGVFLGKNDLDRVVVYHLGMVIVGQGSRLQRRGVGVDDPIQVGLDRFGVHGRAVVIHDVIAQMEREFVPVVRDLPALGQARTKVVGLVLPDQGVGEHDLTECRWYRTRGYRGRVAAVEVSVIADPQTTSPPGLPQFMGSNYEPFPLRTVAGHQEQILGFVIPIDPFYRQFLDQAAENDEYAWSIKGRYKILLPFKEKAIWLDLSSRWNGS